MSGDDRTTVNIAGAKMGTQAHDHAEADKLRWDDVKVTEKSFWEVPHYGTALTECAEV